MPRYVALLGSINVGGNRVKMAELAEVVAKTGCENVSTVAASGNVIFDHRKMDVSAVEGLIAKAIEGTFKIGSLVVVCDRDQIASAISKNPFHGDGEDRFVHSIFLDGQPSQADFDALVAEHRAKGGERLALGKRILYLDYVHGVGVSSLTGAFLKRRLGCRGTARNMTSLKRILAKMED